MLTPSEFGRRVEAHWRTVLLWIRGGLVVGAVKGPTGRWRIPESSVGLFLEGAHPEPNRPPATPRERLAELWLRVEGKQWP